MHFTTKLFSASDLYNLPDRRSALRQKFISGWVVGLDSDISPTPPLVFTQK